MAGADGNLWFSLPFLGRIGRITTAGTVEDSAPRAVHVRPGARRESGRRRLGGQQEPDSDILGRFAPDGTTTEIALPGITAEIFGLVVGPDGNLWFTENDTGLIGRATPAGVVSEFETSSPLSAPWLIAAGPDGGLWFSEYGVDGIGRVAIAPFPCAPGPNALCVNGGRFRVGATWSSSAGSGPATAVSLTDDSGYLWFFDPTNIEIVAKVLIGCAIDAHYWVFLAGLTNVGAAVTVTEPDRRRPDLYEPVRTGLRARAGRQRLRLPVRRGGQSPEPGSSSDTTASASISTSISGSMRLETSTIVEAGRMLPKTSPWAWPISFQSAMRVT